MNKKGIIITVVIAIIALAIGFGSCYAIFGAKKCEEVNCEENNVNKDEQNLQLTEVETYKKYLEMIGTYDEYRMMIGAECDKSNGEYFNALAIKNERLYSITEKGVEDTGIENVLYFDNGSVSAACDMQYLILVLRSENGSEAKYKDLYIVPYNGEVQISEMQKAVSNILGLSECKGTTCTYYKDNYLKEETFKIYDYIDKEKVYCTDSYCEE